VTNPVRVALLKVVVLPGGVVMVRRPPRESRVALTEMIGREPANIELVAMRARAAEEQLDLTAAEVDWKRYAEAAPDRVPALLALADFYHRRLRPSDEVRLLTQAAQQPTPPREALLPPAQQTSWKTFQRAEGVIAEQALPAAAAVANYRAWIARYPREAAPYGRLLDLLVAKKMPAEMQQLLAQYQKAFPEDRVFPVRARASIELAQGSAEAALAVYDREFEPLWPPELIQSYFALLGQTHHLRDYLSKARTVLAANPADLRAMARVFYYYQQQGNLPAAQRPLLEFSQHKESAGRAWTADELWVLGELFKGVQNYPEAARYYYALYSLPGAGAAEAERALAALYSLLITVPEQPLAFGSDDLTFYRDIAAMDPHPGFLNGILSLILNTTQPAFQYSQQERASVAYFHRGAAAEILALFETRFPNSRQRAGMEAELIQADATYGDNDAVVAAARKFLASFPANPERTRVAMLMADAFARQNDTANEFAAYDALLKELAAHAGGVPLGVGSVPAAAEAEAVPPPLSADELRASLARRELLVRRELQLRGTMPGRGQPAGAGQARSPDYARVLDRYISRLVSLKRVPEALALYRREIDRNPNDPGLYERLSSFLEQNQLAAEIEQVYRRAIQQFQDRSWYQKLARWYLRRREQAAFDQLTREVVKIFSGTDLETYFRQVVGPGIDARLYRQLNEFAHQRFPQNLAFVRNLMQAYTRQETYDPAAYEALLRNYWFWDGNIRSRFFEMLSSRGQLDQEMAALRAAQPAVAAGQWKQVAAANPAASRFVAEAEAWRSHFEDASAPMRAIAGEFPADMEFDRRAASLERSLAGYDAGPAHAAAAAGDHTTASVSVTKNLNRAEPRDSQILTFIGETYADRDLLAQARPYWDRIPQITPGRPDGYLEAATVFWDYFQFDDALRLIGEARRKFAEPALYAYEAGAIYENKREYPRAIEEYLKGATSGQGQARSRLLALAPRPALRPLVEKATEVVSFQPPNAAAISVRIAVLETQERRGDLERFLLAVVENSPSLDVLADAGAVAERLGMDRVRARSYERQVAVSNDPIERMRLRLALVRFYESHNDLAAARREVEALYKDNPKSLGIVRAAADFYWRNKLPEPAVGVLLEAAGKAYPQLQKQFTYEAARKNTEAARYAPARQLLDSLLKQDPFNGEYLAAMADTYAREKNDTALRDFYAATIKAMSQAPLAPEERTARVAALRRGLIPALTRLGDYAGAVDQYIEISNRYPEDEGVLREAALYAGDHSLQQKIVGYYTQAAAGSPRDYRWPMVLARLYATFEQFPEAIAAYSRAAQVRPDRVDLYAARAALEERLLRFDDAVNDYAKLYDLACHNPDWMEKVAEVRARQGQTDAAVKALEKARIEGFPERPENFFEVARRLESWDMLPQARQFAERAVKSLSAADLGDPDYAAGLQTYARVMTRLRQYAPVVALLRTGIRVAPQERVPYPLRRAALQMGDTAKTYFTPEEKQALVRFLEQQKAAVQQYDAEALLMPLAERAGLAELRTSWMFEAAMLGARNAIAAQGELAALQNRRMKFEELGQQCEALWKAFPEGTSKGVVLQEAVSAYVNAGNSDAALRMLSAADARLPLSGKLQSTYFELLLAANPQRIAELAGTRNGSDARTAAANFAVANAGVELALAAVQSRGRDLTPVWNRAYTALAGLYYSDADARTNAAFTSALGSMKIGDRIGRPLDRNQQLAGDIWFYYGSRYGEYLDVMRRPNSEDFLPAEIEAHPARASAYFDLAGYYRERGDLPRAVADYEHSLELNPVSGEPHTQLAEIFWQQGTKDQAIAQWKAALQDFAQIQDRGRAPESFWNDVEGTLESVGSHKVLADVRAEADRLLRAYIKRNGTYRVEPLLEGALTAAGEAHAGVAWIIELSTAAAAPANFLERIWSQKWMPESERGAVLDRMIADTEARAGKAYGQEREAMLAEVRRLQILKLQYLVEKKQTAEAEALLAGLPQEVRENYAQVRVAELQIAAQAGRLDALLERYRREPEKAPAAQYLQNAAQALREQGDAASVRKVLEFLFTRNLGQHDFARVNFLGLAEIRLETGNTAEAVHLLRRMTMVAGEPFQTQVAAADLLAKTGLHAEAADFLAERVRAVPWDAAARFRLAQEQLAAGKDRATAAAAAASLAASAQAPYEVRADAAELLGSNQAALPRAPATLGSAELDLLAKGGAIDPVAAEQPFFYRARVAAAARAKDAVARIGLLADAIALQPDAPAEVRIALERAAMENGQYRMAINSLQPMLDMGGLRYQIQRFENAREGSEEEGAYPYNDSRAQFLAGMPAAERAAVARDLGIAYQKLGELPLARLFTRLALELEPSATARATLQKTLADLDAEIEARNTNVKRRPVVSENLEQPGIVRPRVKGGGR
jgi:tetratricopeptide (TPR) repeat protein